MDIATTIKVCDTPNCGNDRGLAVCTKCGKVACARHRLEGTANKKDGTQVQVFVCSACQAPLALSVG